MSEVIVVAKSRAIPGKEAELEAALRACVTPTHKEAGCLTYALHRGADDPTAFALIERWTSREALDAHLRLPHVAALFTALPMLVAEPPEILVLNALGAGDPEKSRL